MRRLSGEEAGFTLVEMLVAMICSIIVLFALTTILVNTLAQTQTTFTRVDATRQGRTAIANIENELHSACIGGGQAPIQAGSDASHLQFLSYDGSGANPTPVWHEISYDPNAHTLTDFSYAVTGSAGGWTTTSTTPTPTSSDLLLSNVTQRIANGTALPVFQYYGYTASSQDTASGGTYWFIPDGTTPNPQTLQTSSNSPLAPGTSLSLPQAAETVEVVINLSVGASSQSLNNRSLTVVNDQVNDAVSLRLTTPPDEVAGTSTVAPAAYGPCQ